MVSEARRGKFRASEGVGSGAGEQGLGRGAVTPACVPVVAGVHRAREAEPEGRRVPGRGGGTHGPPKTRPPLFGAFLLLGFWSSADGCDLSVGLDHSAGDLGLLSVGS